MSIEGRIAVDASFSDLTTGTNSQSLKRLAVASTDPDESRNVVGATATATAAVPQVPVTRATLPVE
ncbi:MAG: hypothetical protein EB027_06605 [Actinobacteria bacterium]|nr:hypothetical protein [Actinomycetota bacterium]